MKTNRPDPDAGDVPDFRLDPAEAPLLMDDRDSDNLKLDNPGPCVEGVRFSGLLDRDRSDLFAAALMTVLIGEQTMRMMQQADRGESLRRIGQWHGMSGESVRKRLKSVERKLHRVHQIATQLERGEHPTEEQDE